MVTWLVRPDKNNPEKGSIIGPDFHALCSLGRGGLIEEKQKIESDKKTPIGQYPFRKLYYRADRLEKPACVLPTIMLEPTMGWCDDPAHPRYNQEIAFPFDGSAEKLWREDAVYTLILTIGHNDNPPVSNRGSAIFVHVARDGLVPTDGCVALYKEDLLTFLSRIKANDILQILPTD